MDPIAATPQPSAATPLPSAATPAPSRIELEVLRVRGLLQSRHFKESLEAAEALCAEVPENRDALYLLAMSQRHLNALPQAFATLERLERHHPGFSRLYQERGLCHVAQRNAPLAIEAFLQGVHINPALPASWGMLESLYRLQGDTGNASMAAAHVATLKRLAPEVVSATSLFSDGEWAAAESMVRAYLLKRGDDVEAMRLLARIGMAREVFDDAEMLLAGVLQLAPDYRAARLDYARTLLERHKYLPARRELETLLQLEPANRQYRTLHATACVGLGEHARASAIYRELLAELPHADQPQSADLHLSLAHCLKTLGHRDEAIASYRAAAAVRPGFGDTYWSLANLKTYRFTDEEFARMRREEANPTIASVDRHHLCFALGKALEDRGEYAEAFRFYERGNALKRAASRYRPELIERNTRMQMQTCTREFFERRTGGGCTAADPIFIVGLPRAGSTLIEQILASHPRVEGTQELADVPRLVVELQGREPDTSQLRYPGVLEELTGADFERFGRRYLDDTRVHRSGRPHFIDKMPNNFRHLGLIHLMLPNARIIDARREPMACCFSNFKQLFANGQEFTYGLDLIARYYRTYLALMGHWNRVLPGRILRIQHEDLVDDLEGNVRRMLDFCGLEFDPRCIEFYKTERSVRTASSEQVRQPLNRDGLDQWRHFEPWLGPLKDALGDALQRYRDE